MMSFQCLYDTITTQNGVILCTACLRFKNMILFGACSHFIFWHHSNSHRYKPGKAVMISKTARCATLAQNHHLFEVPKTTNWKRSLQLLRRSNTLVALILALANQLIELELGLLWGRSAAILQPVVRLESIGDGGSAL